MFLVVVGTAARKRMTGRGSYLYLARLGALAVRYGSVKHDLTGLRSRQEPAELRARLNS